MKTIITFFLILFLISCSKEQRDYRELNFSLKYKDLLVGSGNPIDKYDHVKVKYTGWLVSKTENNLFHDWSGDSLKNKDIFDSSERWGEPYSFVISIGKVIKGWDLGILGMKKGSKRILVIPPKLAYGRHGAGQTIPPFATLKFLVEIVDFEKRPEPKIIDKAIGKGTFISRNDRVQYRYELWSEGNEKKLLHSSIQNKFSDFINIGNAESDILHSQFLTGMKINGERHVYIDDIDGKKKLVLKTMQILAKIKPWDIEKKSFTKTESGLQYMIHHPGAGRKIENDDQVSIHFNGYLNKDYTLFESSEENGVPVNFVINEPNSIKALSEGLKLLREGSEASFIIPSEIGYGDKEVGYVPPNSELRYDIRVISLIRGKKTNKTENNE